MISVHFQGKPFNITVIQVYAPTSNAEEVETEWLYEDIQDLLELTPKKDVLFIIGDWNVKVGIQDGLFQILKDDAVKVQHSICQQIWTNQQWPQDWKRSVFIPNPKKAKAR